MCVGEFENREDFPYINFPNKWVIYSVYFVGEVNGKWYLTLNEVRNDNTHKIVNEYCEPGWLVSLFRPVYKKTLEQDVELICSLLDPAWVPADA